MSRSGYTDGHDPWDMIRYRGAVASAIRGNRGQAFLRELETALLELPKKELIVGEFADEATGDVCLLGSVAVRRKEQNGMSREDALRAVQREYSNNCPPDEIAPLVGIATALAAEAMYENDEATYRVENAEQRYRRCLNWVRSNIKREAAEAAAKDGE